MLLSNVFQFGIVWGLGRLVTWANLIKFNMFKKSYPTRAGVANVIAGVAKSIPKAVV